MKKLSITALAVLVLAGCSGTNDFTPAADADGETIFKLACANCHSTDVGKIFELSSEMAGADAVKAKITNGSLAMPSFPNIKGDQLDSLAQYVLENSKVTE